MSDSEKRSYALLFVSIIALIIFIAPSIACSDQILMLHTDSCLSPAPEAVKNTTKRSLSIGLNENGDLMMSHRDVSLIMAYNPPSEVIDQQERIKNVQKQDCPSISGISLKVSFLF